MSFSLHRSSLPFLILLRCTQLTLTAGRSGAPTLKPSCVNREVQSSGAGFQPLSPFALADE